MNTIEEQLDEVNCALDYITDTITDHRDGIEWREYELKELENQRERLLKEKKELSAKLVG